jgi:demethylmenaquinone methyltransferase/2-methoxy-6-polyprenyl-1,4-benzoquinol methylase
MVAGLALRPRGSVLDVAAGTGSITRLLERRGQKVTALDLSPEMLRQHPGLQRVQARADALPFLDGAFDSLTFGYLLRYVDEPVACLEELRRVVRPGGILGMVEFGMPTGIWRPAWLFYAGKLLPWAGRLISPSWHRVGRFLPRSIEEFHRRHPDLIAMWRQAGLVDIKLRKMTMGSGLVMWGRNP